MKKTLLMLALGFVSISGMAQEEAKKPEGFEFTHKKEIPHTSVKNQSNSGTCWSFSGLGFFESELIRQGKGEFDLSEMYLVYNTMIDRAVASVRLHGDISFSPGGSFYDGIYCIKHYGMVPEEAMEGILYGDSLHNHGELANGAAAYVKAIAGGSSKKLSPVWKNGLKGIYNAYLGQCPESFTYKGKNYTPRTFADETLGLNMDDYISITSYTHHPFYETFALEIPDNWRWAQSYNVPLDEFSEICDYAVKNGYSFAWGSDVSESGFGGQGVAVVPDATKEFSAEGSDQARWIGATKKHDNNEITSKPWPEMEITQEMRQEAYDNWQTTDDHGMQVVGMATDQNGKEYFIVKNSWGFYGKYKGYLYASKAFVAYKTMNIVVHKDGIPKALRKKMGIK